MNSGVTQGQLSPKLLDFIFYMNSLPKLIIKYNQNNNLCLQHNNYLNFRRNKEYLESLPF